MRRSAAASVAGEADPLITLHALTMHDLYGVEVSVPTFDAAPVIEDDDIAVASGTAREAHYARRSKSDVVATRSRQRKSGATAVRHQVAVP
jgi:hypothetical protein